MALSEHEEFELLSLEREKALGGSAPAPRASNTEVFRNALYKGAASIPDLFLNAPNNLLNLGRAGVGTVANLAGRSDLAPDITPNPDLWRRSLEAIGLINPQTVPQGGVQTTIDTLTQGAVGGGLAGMPRAVAGVTLGALSAGAQGATHAVGGDEALVASAGLAVPAGAARVAGGGGSRLSPQKQLLKDEGVTLTPGQIRGGAMKRLEDGATSVPILGDAIKGAQRRGIESFNAAAINRSLEPIGVKLPAGLTGNKAVEYARMKLGDAYESLLPSLRGDLHFTNAPKALPVKAGQAAPLSFKQELDNIRSMGQNLPEPQRGQLGRIIDREVEGRFTPQGKASGETLKKIESEIGRIAKDFRRSDNYDTRTLGDAVKEVQNSMRRMVENVNPQYHGELSKINEGYANFKKVQRAASEVGAQEGVFTPAQLHRAVKAGDTSKDKARFAEGDALMQDLSSAGKGVLPSTVPDSGTPFRAALMYALANPVKAAGLSVPVGLAALPYTAPGQRFSQHLLTNPNSRLAELAARVIQPVTAGSLEERRRLGK